MEDVKKLIAGLESLDLSKYPHSEVIKLLGNMGKVGAIRQTLHPGKVILRARPNKVGERFSKISEISYKPAKFNTTYQRASTPNNTMFYGSFVHENVKPGELSIGRAIGLFEVVPMMRDNTTSGEQVLTYSTWRVMKDIDLVSVVHHKHFPRNNSYAQEQRENFETFLSGHPKEVIEKTNLITEYLGNQFGKDITPNDYDYLISAIYTELVTNNGHAAGVFYPSVRTGGEGFNVAIHPYFVENRYLVPEAVGECVIYKREKETIVDNETVALILDGQEEFQLKPVIPELRIGKENALRKLYPEKYE